MISKETREQIDYLDKFENDFISPLSERVLATRGAAQDAIKEVQKIRMEFQRYKLELLKAEQAKG